MMDKVAIRVPSATQFSENFGALYREFGGDARRFRPSPHYLRVGDLRNFGYHSLLHVHCVHGKAGDHKLELLDSGEMSFAEMQWEIMRVFDTEPTRLGLMRLDLAVDVPDIPVEWFARNARVRWKQWMAEIGQMEYVQMGRRKVQTLYYGRSPDLVRIYDKISELRHQYDQLRRRARGAEIPSFETKFRYPETGFVLTRVERQLPGDRVPKYLNQIGKLRRLPEFNPFARLELLPTRRQEPDFEGYPVTLHLQGLGLRAKVDEIGMHRTHAWLNIQSPGHARRIFNRLADFLPGQPDGIDAEHLYARYRESVCRQLTA